MSFSHVAEHRGNQSPGAPTTKAITVLAAARRGECAALTRGPVSLAMSR